MTLKKNVLFRLLLFPKAKVDFSVPGAKKDLEEREIGCCVNQFIKNNVYN